MKKPDRFERIAEKLSRKEGRLLYPADVAKLLRNEHRAVVKIINEELRTWAVPSKIYEPESKEAFGRVCRAAQCHDILTKLTERGK